MATFTFAITVKTSRKGRGQLPLPEVMGQLCKTLMDTYGEDGEDLMGYDGPTVTVVQSYVSQHE